MRALIYMFISISIFLVTACDNGKTPPPPPVPQYDTLIILSTNDIHAQIGNMAKEAAYIKSTKSRYPNTLIVDAGDIFSGNPVVDQHDDRGYPIIDLMNRMGYNVMALGNHDFDYGQEVLLKRVNQAKFPLICANADFSATSLYKKVLAFDTIHIGNLKVSVLGVLQTGGSPLIPATHPNNLTGIEFSRATDVAFWREWAWLRSWGDVFVVLSHLGADSDTALVPSIVPKPDIIIGGHSHTVLNPGSTTVSGVLVTQTGSNLYNIGRTVITLKDKMITSRQNSLVPVSGLTAEDAEIKTLIQSYQDTPKFKEVIGRASAYISGKETMANLMSDALTDQLSCDIALTNSGGVRLNSLPAGDITLGKVYEIDPFENLIMTYNMSLDELKALLVYTSYYVTASEPNNFNLYISGAKYYYNIASKTVRLTNYSGTTLPSKKYRVAMSTYVAETYMPKITHADQGTLVNKTTAASLADYIRAKGNISPQGKRAFYE